MEAAALTFELQPCPMHGDLMRLFCKDDGKALCAMCYFEGMHRGHNVCKVGGSEYAQQAAIAKYSAKSAREHITFLTEYESKIRKEIDILSKACGSVRMAITLSFNDAREKLNTEERSALGQLEAGVNSYESALNNALVQSQAVLEEATSLSDAISRNNSNAQVSALAQRVQAVEAAIFNIRFTRVPSARVAFKDNKVLFEEYPVLEPHFRTEITVASTPQVSALEVSWSQPKDFVPDRYVLEYKVVGGNGQYVEGYSGKEPRCTLTGLKVFTEYELCVCAVVRGAKTSPCGTTRAKTGDLPCNSAGFVCNTDGDAVHFGTGSGAGVLYCGKRKNQCKCGHCDGRCGPNNGCPCNSCLGLQGKLGTLVGLGCSRGHPMRMHRGSFMCDRCRVNYFQSSSICFHCASCDFCVCPKCGKNSLPEEVLSKITPFP